MFKIKQNAEKMKFAEVSSFGIFSHQNGVLDPPDNAQKNGRGGFNCFGRRVKPHLDFERIPKLPTPVLM